MVTIQDIENNEKVKRFIINCQRQLDELGYTEHSTRHAKYVSIKTGEILSKLGYDENTINIGEISGYLHDIGNCVNRNDHAHTGAILAYYTLLEMGMENDDAAEVMMSIGNHDELTGTPVNPVSAALILADKSDVHKTRVRNQNKTKFDIHDRVNYSVQKSNLIVDKENNKIILDLTIDTKVTEIMDYFEIFTERMLLCKKAANYFNQRFVLKINDNQII